MTDAVQTQLTAFAVQLTDIFQLPGAANPEDQLKAPTSALLFRLGQTFNMKIATKTEAQLSEHGVRPDIAVYRDGLIEGHIELKRPGLGANAPKLKGKNKEQWERLKSLPNLIYSDGREWALFRFGKQVGKLVRFSEDPTESPTAITSSDAHEFELLVLDFLNWGPQVPSKPSDLAAYLAPLARFLRVEVEDALKDKNSNIALLAAEWRQYFFPDADDSRFADAYAQTVTYALLLARLSGATSLAPTSAAKTLGSSNNLLARALDLLGQPGAVDELRVGFEMLQRSLEALDKLEFEKSKPDLWLYFYEDFLAAYDNKLRNDFGVYYTPRQVVEFQVRLASQLLELKFKKKFGFADDGVVFIDPAVGTGTYLVATVKHALEKVRSYSGEGAVGARALQMAENMYGFEILVGPYAVSHLRLTRVIESFGANIPSGGRLKVYLTDTLESPNSAPPGGLTLTYKALTQEHEAARKIKKSGNILVCLGNPPYNRQRIEEGDTETKRKGGWVRFGDQVEGGAKPEAQGEGRPIFDDFLEPARASGHGRYLQVMYNDYLYFWRWALWRLFEQQASGGILTFITASSYLTGPGFVGVREVMRRTFDELWVIDLGGDNLGPRKSPNVFAIQTPVAIAIGIRGNAPSPDTPAIVRYTKVEGVSRDEKLDKLDSVKGLEGLDWSTCPSGWQQPFRPIGKGDYFSWPCIDDIFPWHYNGTQWFRGWTIAPSPETLRARLRTLVLAPFGEKAALFRVSAHRKINKTVRSDIPGGGQKPIEKLTEADIGEMNIVPFSWRSFDRQWAIFDARFGDRLREPLWKVLSSKQVFLTTLMAAPLAEGPAIQAAIYMPDCHVVRGSCGGRDVFPMYLDADASEPNVSIGLIEYLADAFHSPVTFEDVVAYVYAVLSPRSFVSSFWNELETPGPRVPITKDFQLFSKAIELGRRLLNIQTYGERFSPGEMCEPFKGGAKSLHGISTDSGGYPETFSYDPATKIIHVGDGEFGPVSNEIWEFEVSGMKVVQGWLGYRMKVRAGKKSSQLDYIHPPSWTPRMSDEFLELIWALEETVRMEPELTSLLQQIVSGSCFSSDELPKPTDAQKKGPKDVPEEGDLLSIMDSDDEVF